MRRLVPTLLLATLLPPAPASAIDARLLRHPDVSDTQLVFVHGGDVWLAPRDGGRAHRLSTPAGEEVFPRFSPDGTEVAYTANYDGNGDVYVVSTDGGVPRRLTHHPSFDRVLDWHPDGEHVLFVSSMSSGLGRPQLHLVPRTGGLPSTLPVPYGDAGTLSGDGRMLAYTPVARDFRTWKRYRGGRAPDIWLFDLKRRTSRRLTESDANDAQPLWHGRSVYFLSDRGPHRRANLWRRDLDTDALEQVTHFSEQDVRFPAMGPRDIVFEQGGDLYLLDLATHGLRRVEVEVVTDQATRKPRLVDLADHVRTVVASPTGKRVAVEARGEVFTVPAEHGVVRNLTRTSGVAERHPAWSPDGETVAYFSDRSGEYELVLRPADGSGEERQVTELGPGFRYQPYWSPDSRKVAFVDQAMRIWVHDRDADQTVEIDRGRSLYEGGLRAFAVSWSPDSRWLAWSRTVENDHSAVFLRDTRAGRTHQVTSGFYSDRSPVFDPDGEYLYLLTSRSFQPSYSNLDGTWIYANTTRIAALPLRADVASPLAPRDDAEGGEASEDEEEDDDDGDEDEDDGAPSRDDTADKRRRGRKGGKVDDGGRANEGAAEVGIDLDGLERRLVVLPPEAGNYSDLAAVPGKVLFVRRPRTGASGGESPLVSYDMEEREEKTVLDDVDGFEVTADGKRLLVRKGAKRGFVKPSPGQKLETAVDLSRLRMTLDPPEEWRQLFRDAWRLERDYFYDPGLHGVDWAAMRERYGTLLEDAVTRWDVNFVIGELIAELNASHTYRGGGDTEPSPSRGVGMLGVDFELHGGAYRIARIVEGADWEAQRSPLREPGVSVKAGEYVLAVNGIPLAPEADPWAPFVGLAGETVVLTVSPKPVADADAREVVVETLRSESRLRRLEWVEQNRRRVAEATGGRVGYIYVPDTGVRGQTELVRQFHAQRHLDGLVIDERFNGGGQIPDRFVELLGRRVLNYWAVRDGHDWQWPGSAHHGKQVMLINGSAGSGGDAFPYYFRQAGLGPLIGMRTWGGLIGLTGAPRLVDGGVVTVPTFGIYSTEGTWIIEGHGVDPDIEVVDDPALMQDGGDPQLDRAIQEIEHLLAEDPPRRPGKPTYPDRSGS